MDFGMPFLLQTTSLEDCVKLCTELKLAFIELNMNFPQCQPEVLKASVLNKIRNKTGIYFTIHLDENLNICDFNTEVKEAYKRTVCKTIQLAKEIEAPILNMHLAKGIYITLPDRTEYLYKKYEDSYRKSLTEFKTMCDKNIGNSNIKIAVENTTGFLEHEKAGIELLLQSEHFGLTFDLLHSHVVKDIDIPFYKAHISKLIHMHAHDTRDSNNHTATLDDGIDLIERLLTAKKVNSRVVLENKTIDTLTKTVALLNEYI